MYRYTLKPFIRFFLLCLFLFFPAAVFGMAEKPPIVLPDGVLNSPQIEQLVLGKTILSSDGSSSADEVLFFRADGTLTQAREGWQGEGTWSVRDDARLCLNKERSGRDCRIISPLCSKKRWQSPL